MFSRKKILQNGRLDVIEELKEQFNEIIYLSTQEQLINMGQKTNLMNSLKLAIDHMIYLIVFSLKMEH
jgi:hypothetical protein